MKFYIEYLIFVIPPLIFVLWFLWFRLSKIWLRRRYKPENDKGRKGEEHRRELTGLGEGQRGVEGSAQPTIQPILPATSPSPAGEDSKRSRGIFRKLGKRK